MNIIDGNTIANGIMEGIRQDVAALTKRPPCLAVVLVGEHPASKIYVGRKTKACEKAGIRSIKLTLPDTLSQQDLLLEVQALNDDDGVDGILVQLPLPAQIDSNIITQAIDPHKDVDGFHPINLGKMLIGDPDGFVPCTPLGIRVLLESCAIDLEGKRALVIGRSNIVGKPTAVLLLQNAPLANATVTIAHRFSKNVKELSLMADLIVTAIGIPKFLTADMVKPGAVVIDVGINKIPDPDAPNGTRIVGDVDFDSVKEKCSYITPVPGGVGPMTIAMLLRNTLASYKRRMGLHAP